MTPSFLNRAEIRAGQLASLRKLVATVQARNPFQRTRCAALEGGFDSIEEFTAKVPLTTKAEILSDQAANPPYGSNLTFPLEQYTRCHQTSGSTGAPMRWLDTPESWAWMLEGWAAVYAAAGVERRDRIFFAFSFGPFLGFWTAFEAGLNLGALCLPGGGLNTSARLRMILDQQATVLCCTPTYALHLADTASREGLDLGKSCVRALMVAGEPGGSSPATRQRIEAVWPGATVFDHHGMTEVGPVSVPCPAHPGRLHVIETSYLAEILDPSTLAPVPPGVTGELVLTTLGRVGSPLLRYRTGDMVCGSVAREGACGCGRHDLALEGGILGRSDDMVVVRGVNIFPATLDEIIRGFREVAEYQVELSRRDSMAELAVRIEAGPAAGEGAALVSRVERALATAFSLRVPVELAAPGSLPRFEMKARRWIRDTTW